MTTSTRLEQTMINLIFEVTDLDSIIKLKEWFRFQLNTFFQLLCKIIAITLHYLFLVSFCWMAVEGVVLYLLLVKIFRTKTRPARDRTVFFTFSWG